MMKWPKLLKFDVDTTLLGRLSVVSAIIVVGAIALTLLTSLSLVTERANELDDERAIEAMRGAITQSQDHMVSVVTINSVWDDAVNELYAPKLNPDWLFSSYGALAKPGNDYDGVYILDQKGEVLWAYAEDQVMSGNSLESLGQGAKHMFGAIRKVGDAPAPLSALSYTARGPALVGIGMVLPSSGAVTRPASEARYLVLTRSIDAYLMNSYQRAYAMTDLQFTTRPKDLGHAVELKDTTGASLGFMAWTPRHPGHMAAQAAWPRILMSLILVSVLTICLFSVMSLGMKRLAESRSQARKAVITDPLTGLPNRKAFMYRLSKAFEQQASVLLFDLDHFKVLNDTYGHRAGDAALNDIANRLKVLIGDGGFIARLAGDQFGVLIGGPECSQRLQTLTEQWGRLWNPPLNVGTTQISISGTGGFTCTAQGATSPDELFQQAELALTHGKAKARGAPTLYIPQMDAELKERAEIAKGIKKGLERDEFEVVYQPILHCQTNSIKAVEALVRWPRRPGGALGPDVFIEIAESGGSIHDLGMFVLRRACTDMKPFNQLGLSVNLSPVQFSDPRLLSDIAMILAETGFPAQRLVLEITEGHLIDLPDKAEKIIASLHDLEVRVALDDFGMGYSSIGYLRRFVFDKLKIDKSLCDEVVRDSQAGSFLVATVAMAKALGIPVTAEGVETEEQASLLRLAGCDDLQGYLFGRPQPIDQLAARMASEQQITHINAGKRKIRSPNG